MSLIIKRTGGSDYGQLIKSLVCGDAGAGKTLHSSTYPDPIFASAEGGLMSIAEKQIPYVEITHLQQLLNLKNALDRPAKEIEDKFGFPIQTLVVDTVDEMQRIMIRERLEKEHKDAMTLPDWGYIGEQMQSLIRGLRNLKLNVVFTCHLGSDNDSESGRTVYKPGLQGATAHWISSAVDLALVLKSGTATQVIDNRVEKVITRYLQTTPDVNFPWIKDRSGKLPGEFKINFKDDFYRLHNLIYAGVDELKNFAEVSIEIDEPPVLEQIGKVATAPAPRQRKTGNSLAEKAQALREQAQAAKKAAQEDAAKPAEQAVEPESVEVPEESVAIVPETEVTPVASATVEETSTPAFRCEICGDEVTEEQDIDMSRIRFRKIYCPTHFNEMKRGSKGAKS